MRVKVYRNLHKNCFSVQCKDPDGRWRVKFHTKNLILYNTSFRVRESGRQKVLQEKRKNVHAWIEGELDILPLPPNRHFGNEVKYNPYTNSKFVYNNTQTPVPDGVPVILLYPNVFTI